MAKLNIFQTPASHIVVPFPREIQYAQLRLFLRHGGKFKLFLKPCWGCQAQICGYYHHQNTIITPGIGFIRSRTRAGIPAPAAM